MIVLIKNITLLLLLFIFNLNLSSQNISVPDTSIKVSTKLFASFQSAPTNHSLDYIKMFESGKGFAAGKYLLQYNNGDWKIDGDINNIYDIGGFYAKNENNIFFSKEIKPISQCIFYKSNGKNIHQLEHPFGNVIKTIFVTKSGNIWLGGDREISYFDGKWNNLTCPESNSSILQIFADDKNNAWVRTSGNKLFFYTLGQWRQILQSVQIQWISFFSTDKGIILSEQKLFKYENNKISVLFDSPVLNNARQIFCNDFSNIWITGNKEYVLHFNGTIWEKVLLPDNTFVRDISIVNDNEVWACGNNGTILKISSEKNSNKKLPEIRFDAVQPIVYSKNIDDQYGVAIEDFNNDGQKDILAVCIFDPNHLYINHTFDNVPTNNTSLRLLFLEEAVSRKTNGIHENKTSVTGTSKLQLGAGAADIDNDGDIDIYICNLDRKNNLLLNDGNGNFRNVGEQPGRGLGENERSNAAIFADIDNNGALDLFITNEYSTNRLFLNNGSGYFKEVTEESGLTSEGGSMGASFADTDNDGLLDLYVANWGRSNNFYKNVSINGKIKFEDISVTAGIAGEPTSKSNGVVFADYNNDGLTDLFVTNRGSENKLYRNTGNNIFTDVTNETIGMERNISYGASFADFDNDGYLDLYIANVGENKMLKNIEGKKFIDITFQSGVELNAYSTGTATGDIDNDGDVDLYCASFTNGSSLLFVNNINSKNFIILDLEGIESNRDAIGTKIWFYKSGHLGDNKYLLGTREIISGTGYCSHDSKQVHFGTGNYGVIDIKILFPSKIEKSVFNVKAGSKLEIKEIEGFRASRIKFDKTLQRLYLDPDIRMEGYKLLLVLFFISLSIIRWRRRYIIHSNYIKAFHLGGLIIYFILINVFLYRELFLSLIFPLLFITIYLIILHLYFERVVFSKRINEERQKTRNKIARDLHDDLASTISSSKIYLDVLHNSIETDKNSKNILNQISLQMDEAYEKISDLVWVISPSHDSTKDLIARLRINMREQCELKKIAFKNISHTKEIDIIINNETRRNIYSIFKEAFHNSIIHANASEIIFSTNYDNSLLNIQLNDNGKGIPDVILDNIKSEEYTAGSSHGNGLKNMFRRANEISGILNVQSAEQVGTSITLTVKIV